MYSILYTCTCHPHKNFVRLETLIRLTRSLLLAYIQLQPFLHGKTGLVPGTWIGNVENVVWDLRGARFYLAVRLGDKLM